MEHTENRRDSNAFGWGARTWVDNWSCKIDLCESMMQSGFMNDTDTDQEKLIIEQAPQSWAKEIFSGAKLGDRRKGILHLARCRKIRCRRYPLDAYG
jgi:hypothetical protein